MSASEVEIFGLGVAGGLLHAIGQFWRLRYLPVHWGDSVRRVTFSVSVAVASAVGGVLALAIFGFVHHGLLTEPARISTPVRSAEAEPTTARDLRANGMLQAP